MSSDLRVLNLKLTYPLYSLTLLSSYYYPKTELGTSPTTTTRESNPSYLPCFNTEPKTCVQVDPTNSYYCPLTPLKPGVGQFPNFFRRTNLIDYRSGTDLHRLPGSILQPGC